MVSTVTTTVAMIAALGPGTVLGGIATIALILCLVQRELATAAGPRLQPLARNLSVTIAALLVTFGAIVISRLAALL